jgi:uncharacterized protein
MSADTKSRGISFMVALALWAIVTLLAAFEGIRLGLSGPHFAIALAVAAGLFAFELFLAVPVVIGFLERTLGSRGGFLVPLFPLFAVLIYAFEIDSSPKLILAGAAYAVIPALLLAGSVGKPPGTWEDYIAAILIWLPVEFRWMYRIFPYPPQLTHTLTILLALSVGVAALVFFRRLDGAGYAIEWRRGFTLNFILHFVIFAAIAIPLGIKMHFLVWAPTLARSQVRSLPLAALGILLFTAWPEEFLFRGLLQNLLSKSFKNQWLGLVAAAIIFGLSHIVHAPFPNWKYVALAAIAGLFYGHAWMKSGSLVPGAMVHALVDITWHILFR